MQIRRFTRDDIAAMLRLCRIAGWNQTERDIARMLALEPDGCFAACEGGQLVGTATTTTYGTLLGWIGMMLVDPAFRRRGMASALMEAALEYLHRRRVTTIKLDATPEGRFVYERFGFESECVLERWEGVATEVICGEGSRAAWDALSATDFEVFGADRGAFLRAVIAETHLPIVVEDNRYGMLGYAFSRPGFRASYVGPVVADDLVTVRTLLAGTIPRLGVGSVFIDVNTEFPGSSELMGDLGFIKRRELLRMRLGPDASIGRSSRVFSIAGPEVG